MIDSAASVRERANASSATPIHPFPHLVRLPAGLCDRHVYSALSGFNWRRPPMTSSAGCFIWGGMGRAIDPMDMNRQLYGRLFALGSIHPRGSPEGPSQLQAESLIAGATPSVEVTVQFVQAVERQVFDATGEPVEELFVTGRRYSSGDETVEREVRLPALPNRTAAIETAHCERAELSEDGAPAGAVEWRWEPLHGTVEAWVEEIRPGLARVRVEVANRLEWDRASPEQNLMRTLRATQVGMHSPDGTFSPLGDPPPHRNRSGRPALR
jgi:hypothetical protein